MRQEKYSIGTKHITNEGYEIKVEEKIGYKKRRIRFENGYEVVTDCSHILRGDIKNPYHPSVYGIGFLGVGKYKCKIDGKLNPEYKTWTSMLERCYVDKIKEIYPTYIGVTVCEEWHNFQNFAKWYNDNHPKIKGIKFNLDKDLLQQDEINKIYSPKTSVFLPKEINGFLTNKKSDNTSGYIGAHWHKLSKKWSSSISLFGEGKLKHLGYFTTPELASIAYQQARVIESEKAKQYLRNLNYLPEHIIQLVK